MSEKGTEQASPQKKKKAKESGDIVRSRELLSSVSMLCGVLILAWIVHAFVRIWTQFYQECIRRAVLHDGTEAMVIELMRKAMFASILPIGSTMAACFGGALLAGIAQGGGVQFQPNAVGWKTSRFNPVLNLKNLFSLRSSARIAKSLIPACLMVILGGHALRRLLEAFPVMGTQRLVEMFSTSYHLILDAAWLGVVWSAVDYVVEWKSWNNRLKMTKQQLRDEAKDSSGNPAVKGRIRQIQRLMRRRRIKADISRASVVVTNPTHFAVALLFSFETMQAPTVLAKGRDLHAAEIREEARWAGVPLVENPTLARSLYRSVEQGESIPFELYQAVAGILAFLYRQQVEEKIKREREMKNWQASPNLKFPVSIEKIPCVREGM